MPEDAIIHYIDQLGSPILLFIALICVLVFVFLWRGMLPIYQRKADAEIALEQKREDRKTEESKSREARDIERSKNEGRWLEVTERIASVQAETNQVNAAIKQEMEALRIQNKALTDAIQESREGSKTMLGKLDKIDAYIKEKA